MANNTELTDHDRAAPYTHAPQEFTRSLDDANGPSFRCYVWGARGWEVLGYARLPNTPVVGDTMVLGEQFLAEPGTFEVVHVGDIYSIPGVVLDVLLERLP